MIVGLLSIFLDFVPGSLRERKKRCLRIPMMVRNRRSSDEYITHWCSIFCWAFCIVYHHENQPNKQPSAQPSAPFFPTSVVDIPYIDAFLIKENRGRNVNDFPGPHKGSRDRSHVAPPGPTGNGTGNGATWHIQHVRLVFSL